MRGARALVFVAVAALAAPACGPGAPDGGPVGEPVEADRWLGRDREAVFADHVERIAAVAALSDAGFARLGTTWAQELVSVRRRYVEARTAADVHLALMALKNSLHDGHAFLEDDALRPAGPPVSLPLSLRVEIDETDGQTRYIVRAGGALPAGSEVLAVDEVAIPDLERMHVAWFAGGSSPEALRLDVARWLEVRDPGREPAPAPGTTTTLRLRHEDGREQSVVLRWDTRVALESACPPYADACAPDADGEYADAPVFEGMGACVYTTDDPATRVVRYRTFAMPESRDPYERACLERKLPALTYALTLEDADAMGPRGLLMRDQGELLDHLARAGVERVLFDVRDNTGGDFDPIFFGAFTDGTYAQPRKSFVYGPAFQRDPARVGEAQVYVALLDGRPIDDGAARIEQFLREHPDAQTSPPIPFYCQTSACADGEETLRSLSSVVFRAAVLAGPRCFSACDDFVSIFRDNEIAPTLGQPTGAGDSPYSYDLALPLQDGSAATLHVTVGVSFHPGTSTPLEAHPAVIDVALPPTRANRGRYVEAVLGRVPW